MTTPQAVKITWVDAFDGPSGWVDPYTYVPFPIIPVTIGWRLPDDDGDYVTVYSTFFYNEDEEMILSNPVHIPVGMVKDILYLEL